MAVLIQNFLGGEIDAGLTDVATTISSPALAAMVEVAAPDTMAIIVDPDGIGGAPEIFIVTAHTAGATTATVTRGGEGTTARAHKSGIEWVHGATKGWAESLGAFTGALIEGVSGTDQVIADVTWTKLTYLTTEVYDTNGFWSSGSPGDFVIPVAGYYEAIAQCVPVAQSASANNYFALLGIFQNSSTASADRLAGGSSPLYVASSPYINVKMPPRYLAADTVLSPYVYQDTAGSMTLVGSNLNFFSIKRVG